MTTYISILRGINVSGKNLIKMDLLRKSYEGLGLMGVKTYIQSGNVVFRGETAKTVDWEERISLQIEKDFGYKVPLLVLTIDQLTSIIQNHPFIKEPNMDPAFLHITFLASRPGLVDLEEIENKKQNGERIAISENAVYLYCPQGYGKTKLTNKFLEAKLKVAATTRNWRTTNELLKIAKETSFSHSKQ